MDSLISIIVPVYNVEKVLHYCVNSILNQIYTCYELILIDDGSCDSSGELCDQYAEKDKRISVIHKENGGVSSARNAGIEIAKGEYICFIDSDDYVEPNYLEALILSKEEYPECENIWCGFQTVDKYENANVLKKVVFSCQEKKSVVSKELIMDLHEKWLDAGPVCKLYSRKIIGDYGLKFDESISLGEDLIFNFQYLDVTTGKIIIINKCLYNYYYANSSSLSSKFYENMFELYKTINKIMFDCMCRWKCNEEQLTKYYNACFYKYEVVLENTFAKNSTIKNKYAYNNSIMKSTEFKEVLSKSNCFIHPLYRFAYRCCSFRMIRMLNWMTSLRG